MSLDDFHVARPPYYTTAMLPKFLIVVEQRSQSLGFELIHCQMLVVEMSVNSPSLTCL